MRRRVTRLLAATIVAVGVGAAIAGADADPASDVLLLQNVFYPYTPAVSASLQSALGAETSAAARAHFPLKVALIDARQDLGAVPIFFDKPQQYAHFLYQEISFQGKQPLLVVMPDGYGVQGLDAATAAAAASLTKPTGTSSDELARAAITAVRALAAAADHPIKATATPSSPTNSGSATTPILLAVALAVLAAAGTIITLRNRSPGTVRDSGAAHAVVGERVVEPRLVVGALLILGGVVWAIARGLQLYGINLAYDLDQPPVLLVLVGAFLLYRSRRPRVR